MDTGCSQHYVSSKINNQSNPASPLSVRQPDGSYLHSNTSTTLPISNNLPLSATEARIIPSLTTPLMSIGQLCDDSCTAIFLKNQAHILKGPQTDQWLCTMPSDETIITGDRDSIDGLWHAPLHLQQTNNSTLSNHYCHALRPNSTIEQRVAYYHACLGSPTLSTWCTAIDSGHLTSFPSLTSSQVRKHFPHSVATYMGHLDQARQNQFSTKEHPLYSRDLYLGIVDNIESPTIPHRPGTIYADPTGKFITQSSQGNKYILVIFDTDSNYIFAEPLPSRTAHQILRAYDRVHTLLVSRGIKPSMHIMDNEISDLLKSYITQHGSQYQITAPNQHRANAAERAIRTFKNHFISTLCSCDPSFPMHLWDRLLDQTVITLNLLRTSTINPRLSAYSQLHGSFDFNATPLGPPGTKVIVHEKPTQRETWAPHGTEGWYVGPAIDHYRNFTVYIPSTRSIRIADTLAWLPSKLIMPTASSAELAMAAAFDLTQALLNPSPASALSPLSDDQRHSLIQLATIFGNLAIPPAGQSINTTSQPRVEPIDPRVEPSQPMVEPTQPRVEPTQPRVEPTQPRVEPTQPRVEPTRQSEESTQTMGEPTLPMVEECLEDHISRVATTGPLTTPELDLSYISYNHNGNQRRRQAKKLRYNRRHRNPAPPTTPLSASDPPEPPLSIPSHSVIPTDPHSSPAPTSTSTESSDPAQKHVHFDDSPTIIPPTMPARRSTRGHKIARFDPRTHRLIPQHSVNALTVPTITPYSKSADEIRLRQALQGPDATIWERATAMEFGRLAQGLPGLVEGTDTLRFIRHDSKPNNRIASYCRTVCSINTNKAETHRVRLTYGGDRSDYTDDVSTPTVDITTVKIHLNSVISTPGAKYATLDLKNFYLNTPLDRPEYMRIPINIIPAIIIKHYNLSPLISNDHIMVEIVKGIYGLPQAGILAKRLLDQRLLEGGYYPAPHTPGLYLHHTRQTSFTLWVDDFGIKYMRRDDVDHLTALLQQHYELTLDLTGSKYLGLTLRWDYKHRTVDLSMPGYIQRALERFQHPTPAKPEHSPHDPPTRFFGPDTQQITTTDGSPAATSIQIKRLQEIIGVLLYYARMVDMTLLVSISTIASQQSQATEATLTATTRLLNYCATHPNATVRFKASDMILHIVSDASYLSASGARSRVGGYFFMSQLPSHSPPLPTDPPTPFNGPVLVNSTIIQAVLSSAAEAELGALFYNAKDGCMLRNTLADLGHPQPATPIQADNACAVGLANDTMKQKRSKAIDMRFYWVRDRVKQGQFVIYWRQGSNNDADYFTKHHAPSHHRKMRNRYLHVDELDHLIRTSLP